MSALFLFLSRFYGKVRRSPALLRTYYGGVQCVHYCILTPDYVEHFNKVVKIYHISILPQEIQDMT